MGKFFIVLGLFLLLFCFGCASGANSTPGGQSQSTQNEVMSQMLQPAPVAVGPVASSNPYFTGEGGKGMTLAVLEPTGERLSTDEQWMLSLIQGSITGDFNKFSNITVTDRQNYEKVLAEQNLAMSGNYSDEDYIRIGQFTNTRFILAGIVRKTPNNYLLELYVTDIEKNERIATYSPTPISLLALENLSAVREATVDLLGQLGVNLTARGLNELKSTVNTTQIQAETALARGITAQRQGTTERLPRPLPGMELCK